VTATSPNFAFLEPREPLLCQLGTLAERFFLDDPNTCLLKLRQFGEVMAQRVAAYNRVYTSTDENQIDILRRLESQQLLPPRAAELLHGIRIVGNRATHQVKGDHGQALQTLKMAREAAVWFHRSFVAGPTLALGPFVPPARPADATEALTKELARMRAELDEARTTADRAKATAEEHARLRESSEDQARREAQDRVFFETYAAEVEARLAKQAQDLAALQAQAEQAPAAELKARQAQAQVADNAVNLNEAATRLIIDEKLRIRGWEVDTEKMTYAAGTRPTKKRNLAISEWPTASGPVDYALFCGLTCVGVIEAKRDSKDVPSVLGQTKRYSRDFTAHDDVIMPGGPWGDYRVPFIFATNGRPFLEQLKTKSGIWFWDARQPGKPSRPLGDWYTPKGLQGLLEQDADAAQRKLETEPFDYLGLHDYQIGAIKAVEDALARGQRALLLAMATGTGKTRTALGLIYRMVKTGRFRRVLFLVDRTSLGDQAAGVFKNVRLEQLKPFSDIYDVKELGDITPEDKTRLQVATIQGMIRRVLFSSNDADVPPVDQYDCLIVDECHRGYILDRELSDAELTFRDEADYVSKYRRVIDHFDCVKIGLTATPALHTTEIFGAPVFTYTYRDAVIDGYLVDHEPPYRIVTNLADHGISFRAGEEVEVYRRKQQLTLFRLPDDVQIDVEDFNRQVITENFNRAISVELAKHIDPSLPGKTLVFCVNRDHADLFVMTYKEALVAQYGEVDDDTVVRITGDIDKPRQAILRFRNEPHPKVAVTVDLLTTGIDVPSICNLVFIRRVRSRILYEQMLGRATRLCPEINKEYFRIFDCVDLYQALSQHTDMKPVVQNVSVSFAQLVQELGTVTDEEAREGLLDQILAKLQVRARKIKDARLDDFTDAAGGLSPRDLVNKLRHGTPAEAAAWFGRHTGVLDILDAPSTGDGPPVLVSHHPDEVKLVERGYGKATKPADFLASFRQFLATHRNEIPALLVVTQRPRDLTRQQLREVKLVLDQAGYPEAALRTAVRELSNKDVAASIIGYIRQQALGEPLFPYSERVARAMYKILSSRQWTDVQRKWLERIEKQLLAEVVVDRQALDSEQFREAGGGFARLDKIFGGELTRILGDINEALWEQTG
jgi:type I restriction enzyme, R subunit